MNLYPYYSSLTQKSLDMNHIVDEIRELKISSLSELKAYPELFSRFTISLINLVRVSASRFHYNSARYIGQLLDENTTKDEKRFFHQFWLDNDIVMAGLEKILTKFETLINAAYISPTCYLSMLVRNAFMDELAKTTPYSSISIPIEYASQIEDWIGKGASASDIEKSFPDVLKNHKRTEELRQLEETANEYASSVDMDINQRTDYVSKVSDDYLNRYKKIYVPYEYTSLNKIKHNDDDSDLVEFGEVFSNNAPAIDDSLCFNAMLDDIFNGIEASSERDRTKKQMILGIILMLNIDAGFGKNSEEIISEFEKSNNNIVTFYNNELRLFTTLYKRPDLYKRLCIKHASDFSATTNPTITVQKLSKLKDMGRTAVRASSVLGR